MIASSGSKTQPAGQSGRPSAPDHRTHKTPAGHRVLHVVLPEHIFNHAKAQAYLSGIRFSDYVALSLADAGPIQRADLPGQPSHGDDAGRVQAPGGRT